MTSIPAHYPPITEASLTPFRAIEVQLSSNPDLLDDPKCPYPPMVKAMLRRLTGAVPSANSGSLDMLVDAAETDLDREIGDLYQTVKTDMKTYSGSDMKDKMAFLKTAQDLLGKLVDMQQKRFNIRNSAKMQRAVVECLEGYLTPAQRTEFIGKLEGYVDVA